MSQPQDINEESLRKMVNDSGFPFQLRVAREVEVSKQRHPWRVVAEEHRWINSESGTSGFIDLILQTAADEVSVCVIVECKRTRADGWVFLTERDRKTTEDVHALSDYSESRGDHAPSEPPSWHTIQYGPSSATSAFCILPGQDKKRPMLERLCTELLDSIECFAEEQLASDLSVLFFPLIVTNAPLFVCDFWRGDVDLATGELPKECGHFQPVDYIRFRKSFHVRFATSEEPKGILAANKANERTVFVVHSPKLADFLAVFRGD